MPADVFMLRKMQAELLAPVRYSLQLDNESLVLNELLEQSIHFTFLNEIYCIHCGRKTNKSFQQGYCFPCYRRLQECNLCVIHPERCLVEQGNCDPNDWAHAQCHQQHIVYLANSSALKVGITRHNHVPTRWLDQGASEALPIFRVSNRYQAGLVEVAIKQHVSDKTNWRRMLQGVAEPVDLLAERDRLLQLADHKIQEILQQYGDAIELIAAPEKVDIEYPVAVYPEKIKSFSFDKTPEISGVLKGIKGQYLILDQGVLNLRKFGGYKVQVSY